MPTLNFLDNFTISTFFVCVCVCCTFNRKKSHIDGISVTHDGNYPTYIGTYDHIN